MAFSGMVLTTKGVGLLAKVQAGATLTFTKLKVGDGTLASPATLEALNDLISPKLVVGIGSVDVPSAGLCRIRGTLNNSELESGFFFREIGAFANDPDLGEILYAVANAGAECDYLPAGGGAVAIEQVMDVILSIGSAANVTAVIDGSLYATKGELDSHNTDPSAHALPDLYLPLAGGTMTGAINEAKGADIASADTCDIGAATGNYVQITGTATINSFGTAPAGTVRRLRFLAALTLTHNATSLILPEGANITTVPGDIYEFTSEGGGNWRMTGYMPASGKYNPVVASASVVGGVKVGANLSIDANGVLSASAQINYDNAHFFSSNGYQKLSNGLLIQWGQTIAGTTLFPTAFTNSVYRILLNDYDHTTLTDGAKKAGRTYYTGVSTTGFQAKFTYPQYTHDNSVGSWVTVDAPNCDYIAIGA
jgi:hypothetical protein